MWKIIVSLLALFACGPAVIMRLDTSRFVGIALDSTALTHTVNVYRAAHPREAALCYFGEVRDTSFQHHGIVQYIIIHSAETAKVLETTETSVILAPDTVIGYKDGCRLAKDLLGAGHNHPTGDCTHSDVDALFLFRRTDLYFSLLICPTGNTEILWQDGRRQRGG